MIVARISALTIKVSEMARAVHFYQQVLGLELLYGGATASFSSLRARDPNHTLLNLEQGLAVSDWGRIIFYVDDVDQTWVYLKDKGFQPDPPRDATWGERYFHLHDPDGNELSFAQPLR